MKSKKIVSNSAKETKEIAAKTLKDLKNKRIISLEGELGGGKTTFVQGFAKAFGITKVKSPTFIIMRKYRIEIENSEFKNLYHFDAYRIGDSKEILQLGWEKITKDRKNIILVEWGDKIKEILPKDTLSIKFKFKKENIREIKIL